MKHKERGFTLLEAVFAVLFFAILMSALMQFFLTIYKNSKDFQDKTYLMDNARNINAFIQDKIREAEYINIQIKLPDGECINLVPNEDTNINAYYSSVGIPTPALSSATSSVSLTGRSYSIGTSDIELSTENKLTFSGDLQRILIFNNTNDTYNSIEFETIPSTESNYNRKGKYRLLYKTFDNTGVETGKMVISEQVEEMKASMTQDSYYVTFRGTYKQNNSIGTSKTITDSFSESLLYKQKVE